MRKIIVLAAIAILFIIMGFFFFQQQEGLDLAENETEKGLTEEEMFESEDYLDMQGYYLYPPEDYVCEGGFADGYRYLDAKCIPKGRSDYVINVGAGLASSGINWEEGKLVGNQIVARSFEFTGGQYGKIVCEEFYSEDLKLDAEHYLCKYLKDGDYVITMGVGKSFYNPNGSFGRWFEADLIIKEENDDYEESDYIDELVKFLDKSVKINWDDYAPES